MPPFVPRKRRHSPSPSPRPTTSKATAATKANSKKKATLFDAVDESEKALASASESKAFLEKLGASEESSGISDAESDDFEDALPPSSPAKRRKVAQDEEEDDDEGMDWEDAIAESSTVETPAPQPTGDLELTLDQARTWSSFKKADGSKKGPSKIERQIRIDTHRMHVQFLLWHNVIRNSWVSDAEVQANLKSHLTPGIFKEIERWQKACGSALDPKQKPPQEEGVITIKAKRSTKLGKNERDWGEKAQRLEHGPNMSQGDPTLRLLKILCTFWRKKFTVSAPGLRKQGYKEMERLQSEVKSFQNDDHDVEEHGERITNLEEFRQLAKRCEGSRDTGAQFFTGLVRSLGIEARLVANLQPVGFTWTKSEEAAAKSTTKKAKTPEKSTPKKVPVKPLKTKPGKSGSKEMPIDLSDSDSDLSSVPETENDDDLIEMSPMTSRSSGRKYDRDVPFAIYWTEVLSPVTHKWTPVDSIITSTVVTTEDQLASFEPRGAKADRAKQVLAYVVAFSENGTAKDVTTRYLKRHTWPGKTKGVRMLAEQVPVYNKRGKIRRFEEYDWFKTVMSGYTKHERMRNIADDIEDATDLKAIKMEKKPKQGTEETLQGYKNSAEFVLERHLRREEALLPDAKVVKIFTAGKGEKAKEEPVYRREDVVVCRTTESWHKEGREVKVGAQPLKYVPTRAVTLIRKREIEEAERDSGEKLKQPLYSKDQTKWIIPSPIENGIIPKNAFGNIDVYVPSMVPKGAVHLKLKGSAKICRRLNINYAEACTGFEFGRQRAVPVLTGVVVAAEHKGLVVDAWRAAEKEKLRKENEKREKIALGMWKKLLTGLRIVERLRHKYGDQADAHIQDAIHPMSKKGSKARGNQRKDESPDKMRSLAEHNDDDIADTFLEDEEDSETERRGGFVRADEERDIDFEAAGPGGFLLDDQAEDVEEEGEATHASETQSRTPISLQSLKKSGPSKVVASESSTGDSSSSSELSELNSESSFESAPKLKSTSASNRTTPGKTTDHEPTKRKLPRRSTAVRSHYFDNTSDEDIQSESLQERETRERAVARQGPRKAGKVT